LTRTLQLLLSAALLAPLAIAQSKYVNDVLALNPRGYWRLNGDPNDATANGNNGVLANGAAFTAAGQGPPIGETNNHAAVFNGASDQYINFPGTGSGPLFAFDGTTAFTMMIWAKTRSTTSNMILLAKEENSGNYRGPYLFIDNGPGGIAPPGSGRFGLILQGTPTGAGGIGGNFLGIEALVSVNDNNWHFLVATYDGSGQASGIRLYVDGTAAANTQFGNGNSLNGIPILNSVPVTIGSRDSGGVPATGQLAEAAILGTVITAQQVQQLRVDAGATGVLPHIAVGGSFVTDFYVVNSGDQPANFSIGFYDDSGHPVSLPIIGLRTLPVLSATVPAHGTTFYEAGIPQIALIAGSGVITADASITIQALFRRLGSDGSYYEASVPSSRGFNEFTIPFDATTFATNGFQIYTGIAIANLDATTTANVECTARDPQGNVITNAVVVPALNPLGHWANYLFPALTSLRGTLDCTSNTKIGAIGIRALGGNAISSLPVIVVQ
jgi:hypothetical protein